MLVADVDLVVDEQYGQYLAETPAYLQDQAVLLKAKALLAVPLFTVHGQSFRERMWLLELASTGEPVLPCMPLTGSCSLEIRCNLVSFGRLRLHLGLGP